MSRPNRLTPEPDINWEKRQTEINKAADKMRAWMKLNEEYSQLCEKFYGDRRKGRFYTIEETIRAIEDLKQKIEDKDKPMSERKPDSPEQIKAEVKKIKKALGIKKVSDIFKNKKGKE